MKREMTGKDNKSADNGYEAGIAGRVNFAKQKPGSRKVTAREAALDILTRVEAEKAYSNLLLNQTLQKLSLSRPDAGLATEIVYGTIQRQNTIDYFLERFVAKGLTKLQPWVRNLLRLSFYQLYYLDRIPEHAVVNEAVRLAKIRGHQGISGMVNGVLRNALRHKDRWVLPDNLNQVARIALTHSHPEWMVASWVKQFGVEVTERICAANNLAPHVSLRVNTLRQDRDALLRLLKEDRVDAQASPLALDGIIVEHGGNMAFYPGYAEGSFSIQDESSMLVAQAFDPHPGMHVLDCCAAPGGKTSHIAEKMQNNGKIVANDIHEHKRRLIEEQAVRLGLTCIEATVSDARLLADRYPEESFDRILLDAPCSGLGVIRRKPDLKWTKTEADIANIVNVQYEILSRIHRLLKPGGVLLYSTCTIQSAENQGNVLRFLRDHPEFNAESLEELLHGVQLAGQDLSSGMAQILPHEYYSDGFFIARLRKRKKSD